MSSSASSSSIDDDYVRSNNQDKGQTERTRNDTRDSKTAVCSPNHDETNKAESSMVQSESVEGTQSFKMEVTEENAAESSESESENEDHFVRRSTRDPSLSMLERADVKKLVSYYRNFICLLFKYII